MVYESLPTRGGRAAPQRSRLMEWAALAAFIGGCVGVGAVSSLAMDEGTSTWFRSLARPDWEPPRWVFAPVWYTLYTLMGTAAWLVWKRWGWRGASRALGLFGLQLALNGLWMPLFFGLHAPGLALVDAVALWLTVVATIAAFAQRSTAAAWLMAPYLAWLTYATALNWRIWQLNP